MASCAGRAIRYPIAISLFGLPKMVQLKILSYNLVNLKTISGKIITDLVYQTISGKIILTWLIDSLRHSVSR